MDKYDNKYIGFMYRYDDVVKTHMMSADSDTYTIVFETVKFLQGLGHHPDNVLDALWEELGGENRVQQAIDARAD